MKQETIIIAGVIGIGLAYYLINKKKVEESDIIIEEPNIIIEEPKEIIIEKEKQDPYINLKIAGSAMIGGGIVAYTAYKIHDPNIMEGDRKSVV